MGVIEAQLGLLAAPLRRDPGGGDRRERRASS